MAQNNRGTGYSSNRDLHCSQRLCRQLARSHYENFVVASILLPRRLRQPFYDIYAFCRLADDLADESGSPELALARLQQLEAELNDTFAGQPPGGIFPALDDTIERFQLPASPFHDLLDAFRQDQRQFRYANKAELLDYCRRSANPVGQIVLRLGECYDQRNAELSDLICTGLQLANFWQDVARDYAIGRIYLPADEMAAAGVTAEMLAQPTTPLPLRQLLAKQCDHAETLFRQGLPLAERVPSWFAADIRLFAEGGLATLAAIRAINFDVLALRPTVPRWRQLSLIARVKLGWL